MIPQTQRTNTDCLAACVATLLNYKIEQVPDFTQSGEVEGCPYPGFWIALQSWLSERGLFFLEINLPENFPWAPLPLPALCILMGETKNGTRHAIVGRAEGGEFIQLFNPSVNESELTGVAKVGFLIPRDPALPVNLGKTLEKVGQLAIGLPASPISDNIRHEIAAGLGLPGINGHKIIIPSR